MTTLHPFRCETCTNKREVPGKPDYSDYNPGWYPEYIRCLADDHIMTRDDYTRICSVGCASHSDAEKILDMVLDRLVEEFQPHYTLCKSKASEETGTYYRERAELYEYIFEKIEEIRKKAGEPE